MEWQLRVYEINDGELDSWMAEWSAHVAPLRRRFGFEIVGPWVDGHTFVWLLGYAGDDGFAAADARYYESEERKRVDPNPARHIATGAQRMLT